VPEHQVQKGDVDSSVSTGERLASVFQRAIAGRETEETLKAAVCEYVDRLRDSGLPPEKTLIRVKRALGFDMMGHRAAAPAHGRMVARMITDCIRHYYKDADTRSPSRASPASPE
jgi:hypothetical protein